jgi:hypothetical protein
MQAEECVKRHDAVSWNSFWPALSGALLRQAQTTLHENKQPGVASAEDLNLRDLLGNAALLIAVV